MSDPVIQIGTWRLRLSKWSTLFRRKPRPMIERYKLGLDPVSVVFGIEKPGRRPPRAIMLRVGEYELPIRRWAKLTAQRSTDIVKRLKAGLDPVDAVFFKPPRDCEHA